MIFSKTKIPSGRPLYIWGTHGLGVNICRSLEGRGLKPTAFIDAGDEYPDGLYCGYPVIHPATFEAAPPPNAFVITAAEGREKAAREACARLNFTEGADFISGELIRPYAYNIDVAGACNLRCVSCPRGNLPPQGGVGFMPPERYEKILAKIVREDPSASAVFLFIWGEPLLHPQLPRLIEMTRAVGLRPLISSNLKDARNLEAVVKAVPPWLKVSASGFGPKNYEKTHTGATWTNFEANMRKLSQLRQKYAPEMIVDVAYHLYRHNLGEERRKMRALCEELGFVFRDIVALVQPLNKLMPDAARPWGPEIARAMDMLILPASEAWARAAREKEEPCTRLKEILIGWDGHAQTCCAMFGPENILAPDFLKISLDEIYEKRLNCELCRRCLASGAHRFQAQYQHFPIKSLNLEEDKFV